jgi:hypothetical protein
LSFPAIFVLGRADMYVGAGLASRQLCFPRPDPSGRPTPAGIVYGFDLGFASYNTGQSSLFSTPCTTADVKCLEP